MQFRAQKNASFDIETVTYNFEVISEQSQYSTERDLYS